MLRRVIVAFALLAIADGSMRAQASAPPDLTARVNGFAAATFSTLRQNGYPASRLPGLAIGAAVEQPLNGWLSLAPGVSLIQKGTSDQGEQMRVTYLEAPLLLRATIKLENGVRLFAITGVAPELRLGGGYGCGFITNPNNPDGGTLYFTPGVEPSCSRRDQGFVFGGGVRHDGARMRYLAELRRTVGTDLYEHSPMTVRNDVISLALTAQLKIR
jgi:hypothetical protein